MSNTGERAALEQADVAAILEELRGQVRARRIAQGQIEPSPLERDLQRSLDEIELHRVVSAHWPLIGQSIPQRAVALVNKLVRRYLRWYINPIVEQQNAYNDAVARTLRLLADAYLDLGEQIGPRQGANQPAHTGAAIGHGGNNQELGAVNHGRLPVADTSAQAATGQPAGAAYADLMPLVRSRAAAEPPARFPDLALRAQVPQLRLRAQVSAHWPLSGKSVPERAVALANKLVRRYLRWYINPIVEQQNAANAAISAALLAAIQLDAERRAQVAAARAR